MAALAAGAVMFSGWLANRGVAQLAQQQGRLDASARVAMLSARMAGALDELSAREVEILATTASAGFDAVGDGESARREFRDALAKLEDLRNELGEEALPIDDLGEDFGVLAASDSRLLEQARRSVAAREALRARADAVTGSAHAAAQQAQGLQGKISLAAKRTERQVRKLLRDERLAKDTAKVGELIALTTEATTGNSASLAKEAQSLEEGVLALEALAKDVLLTTNPDLLASLAKNEIAQTIVATDRHLEELAGMTEGDEALAPLVANLRTDYTSVRDALAGADGTMIDLQSEALEAEAALRESRADLAAATGNIHAALSIAHDRLEEIVLQAGGAVRQAETGVRRQVGSTVIVVSAGMLLASGVIVLLVVVPLRRAARAMREIGRGDGDLTQRLRGSRIREISALTTGFNEFTRKIRELIVEVTKDMTELSEVARRNQGTVEENVSQVELQEQGSQQIAGAATELAATIREMAKSGATAADGAQLATESATRGSHAVREAVERIEGMTGTVSDVATTVRTLADRSERVGDIVSVIQSIAKQTNLLSLNATIEANRAGEHGLGFAVVAGEVRNLAIQTRDATQEIQEIIGRLQEEARSAQEIARSGDEQAQECLSRTQAMGDAFAEISQAVKSITSLNVQIAGATEEQAVTTEEIQKSILGMSRQAKTVLDGTREISQSSETLDRLSGRVRELMGQFRV